MNQSNSINISQSSLRGSPVTIDNSVRQEISAAGPVRVGDLRSALTDAREALLAAVDDEIERADVSHELDQLDRELGTDEPVAAKVTTRWERVLAVVGGVVPVADKVTDLVHKLFGS